MAAATGSIWRFIMDSGAGPSRGSWWRDDLAALACGMVPTRP
jgi:hypothetical protein